MHRAPGLAILILLTMGSTFKSSKVVLLSMAALAVLSCEKERFQVEVSITPAPEKYHIMQVFPDDATKTALVADGDNYNVEWTGGDCLAVYEDIDGTLQTLQRSIELEDGGSTSSFVFNLKEASGSEFKYTFVYPASALSRGGTAPSTFERVYIPSRQVFSATSFDPAADLLVSETISGGSQPTALTLRFARVGSTARMTLKGISSNEIIRQIRFSTTEGNLTGFKKINVSTGEIDPESNGVYSGDKSIELIPETPVKLDGSIPVWFRLYDITLADNFTVFVRTDKAEYTKTVNLKSASRELEFADGGLTKFNVDLSTATRLDTTVGAVYSIASSISSGYTYLIAGRYAGTTYGRYCVMGAVNGNRRSAVELISETDGILKETIPDQLTVPDGKGAHPVVITQISAGVYSIYDTVDENYIGADSKGLITQADAFSWNISFTDGIPSITSSDPAKTFSPNLYYNYFGAYNGVQDKNTLLLYVMDAIGISFAQDSYSMVLGDDDYSVFAGQSVFKRVSDLRTVTYTMSGAAIGTINSSTGVITLNGSTTGTATITATVGAGGGYIAGSVSYTVSVYPVPAAAVPGSWLEMPSWTTSSLTGTTTSSLSDLYSITHKALMGGRIQRNYSLLYDPETYSSYWVAYPLCRDHITTGRKDSWAYDPEVPTAKQTNCTGGAYGVDVPSANYASQYYSRGHQIPNADRNNVAAMQEQTYYMTNITPQLQFGLNGGIWSSLEGAVRNLTSSTDTVYVVTGAAFRKKGGSETINTIKNTRDKKILPVPNYYWKALLKVKRDGGGNVTSSSTVGFWLDHQEYSGDNYASYAVTVDQIEEWTGLDLFANLPGAVENNSNWTTFKSF